MGKNVPNDQKNKCTKGRQNLRNDDKKTKATQNIPALYISQETFKSFPNWF
jgi:hypothetical protein